MNFDDIAKTIELEDKIISRRQFFAKNVMGLGSAALASLLPRDLMGSISESSPSVSHFPARAKRVIYVSLIGAPSQFETFDYKPQLKKDFKKDIKEFLKESGQRLTGMTANQASFRVAKSFTDFKQYGEGGTWISDILPWHGKMADDICVIKSMHTDAINHVPANHQMFTGSMIPGAASTGSWLSYGLGSMNKDLPTFCVLHAQHSSPTANVQALSSGFWSSGFLPGKHTGVNLRTQGNPVLYLKDAPGISRDLRRKMLDGLSVLNQETLQTLGDKEVQTRIEQYEMAYRMQMSVPELTDMSDEKEETYQLYGPYSKTNGSFAHCAIMARRLAERGVRFTQIFHRGWDQHGNLPRDLSSQCKDVDQACYGLIQDLKRRGLLDSTLVIFAGEFGRTVYSQGSKLSEDVYGRDHHPRAFSIWMAGAGVKGGMSYGETDKYSFNIATPDQKVHVRDLHATILERCGIDHHKLAIKSQGLDKRLTGVEPARVVTDILDHSHMVKH